MTAGILCPANISYHAPQTHDRDLLNLHCIEGSGDAAPHRRALQKRKTVTSPMTRASLPA